MDPSSKSVYEQVPSADLNTYQELFSFFDKEDTGAIPLASVPLYIRGLGFCPTEAELAKIMEGFSDGGKKEVSFHQMICFLARNQREQQIEEKLIDAFNVIHSTPKENESGSMPISHLRRQLMEIGEPLSDYEVRELTEFLNSKDLRVGQQEFNFRVFCRVLAYAEMEI